MTSADPLQPLYYPARLAELDAAGLLDTVSEDSFDRITRLAADFLEVPLALVNLVDDRRQFAKSCFAPAEWEAGPEAPLSDSYCKWAVATRAPLVVEDATADPRFSHSVFLTEWELQSYRGIPLVVAGGHALGTLCLADFTPRRWTERDERVLSDWRRASSPRSSSGWTSAAVARWSASRTSWCRW